MLLRIDTVWTAGAAETAETTMIAEMKNSYGFVLEVLGVADVLV